MYDRKKKINMVTKYTKILPTKKIAALKKTVLTLILEVYKKGYIQFRLKRKRKLLWSHLLRLRIKKDCFVTLSLQILLIFGFFCVTENRQTDQNLSYTKIKMEDMRSLTTLLK